MTQSTSTVLPTVSIALQILFILSLLSGLAVLALLVVMPNEHWTMTFFALSPWPEADRLIIGPLLDGVAISII